MSQLPSHRGTSPTFRGTTLRNGRGAPTENNFDSLSDRNKLPVRMTRLAPLICGSVTTPAPRRANNTRDRGRSAAIPVHQRRFVRPPAMPLIPFDIRHDHTPTDPGKFSNWFSEHPLRTPRNPENRYVSSAYGHPGTERDLS